jgi:hypothetical protein
MRLVEGAGAAPDPGGAVAIDGVTVSFAAPPFAGSCASLFERYKTAADAAQSTRKATKNSRIRFGCPTASAVSADGRLGPAAGLEPEAVARLAPCAGGAAAALGGVASPTGMSCVGTNGDTEMSMPSTSVSCCASASPVRLGLVLRTAAASPSGRSAERDADAHEDPESDSTNAPPW